MLEVESMDMLAPLLALLTLAQEGEYRVTTHSELVLLEVSVKDKDGASVSNLQKANFRIFENGKLQTISQFSREDVPVTVGLVIDNSGSMRPKRAEVITAGLAFVRDSNPGDEIFVTHFNDKVRSGLPGDTPFTADVAKLRDALMSGAAEGKTALYDAIAYSLKRLESGKQDKKTLVLVSDGGDNASVNQYKDVMTLARESRATIYTVGIFDESDQDRNPGLLRRLAATTGGEAFFPKEPQEVVEICREIAKDIRNRYTIGYVPSRVNEKSALRSIKVSVVGAGERVIVHARNSYLLPDWSPAASGVPGKFCSGCPRPVLKHQ
jgi:Ca-activated chloride channel family protein